MDTFLIIMSLQQELPKNSPKMDRCPLQFDHPIPNQERNQEIFRVKFKNMLLMDIYNSF